LAPVLAGYPRHEDRHWRARSGPLAHPRELWLEEDFISGSIVLDGELVVSLPALARFSASSYRSRQSSPVTFPCRRRTAGQFQPALVPTRSRSLETATSTPGGEPSPRAARGPRHSPRANTMTSSRLLRDSIEEPARTRGRSAARHLHAFSRFGETGGGGRHQPNGAGRHGPRANSRANHRKPRGFEIGLSNVTLPGRPMPSVRV
jgi:hypothetical protein